MEAITIMDNVTLFDIVNANPEYKKNVKSMRDRFVDIWKSKVTRNGADELITWLDTKSDFFVAPASTRYHLDKPGGLCEHSLNVYNRLVQEYMNEMSDNGCIDYTLSESEEETLAICGLLHDICKTNFYTVEMRNRKNDKGQWEKYPYFAIDDQLPYGHGEKSVYMISGFMRLSREEAMAIRWHMGAFDDSVRGGCSAQSLAFRKFKLATILHIADMKAAFLDEVDNQD